MDILPAVKGQGSVNQGIQLIQGLQIWVTKRSVNLINEYRRYMWLTDRDGKILNKPEGGFDHCFAPDTFVHTIFGKKKIKDLVGTSGFLSSRDGLIKRYHSVRATRRDTEIESKIYKDWVIVDGVPDGAKLERRGLDYGYTNDPTAIVDVYKYNGGYVLDEVLYKKGMSNRQIADVLLSLEGTIVVPDSSEPKSNDEIKSYCVVS